LNNQNHITNYDWNLLSRFNFGWLRLKYFPYTIGFIYAVTIFIIALIWHKIGDYNVETDFYWTYAPQAASLLNGELLIDDFKGPGYPILLALARLIVGDYFIGGIFLSAISSGIVIIYLYKLIAKLFSADVGFLVVLITITNKIFVQYSYTASTDMVFYAVIMISLHLFWKENAVGQHSYFLSGIVSGFAYLVRYNGAVLFVIFVILFVVMNIKNRTFVQRLKHALYFIAGYSIIVAPWSLFLYMKTGDLFYQKNYLNIAFELYGKRYMNWDDWWTKESYKFTSFTGVIFHEPLTFIKISILNIYNHLLEDLVLLMDFWFGIISLLAGFTIIIFKLDKKQFGIIIYGICYFTFLLPLFYAERFTLPLLGVYSLLAIIFFSWLGVKISKITSKIIIVITIAVFLMFSAANAINYNIVQIGTGPKEVLNISSGFYNNFPVSERGKIVIARKPQIAYCLQMKFEPFPNVSTLNELIFEIRKRGVEYLYFSSMEAKLRPQFKKIFRGDAAPSGFELVAISKNPIALLYKINQNKLLLE
jgi:hypothetical protein